MNAINCAACGDEMQRGLCRACIDSIIETRVKKELDGKKRR